MRPLIPLLLGLMLGVLGGFGLGFFLFGSAEPAAARTGDRSPGALPRTSGSPTADAEHEIARLESTRTVQAPAPVSKAPREVIEAAEAWAAKAPAPAVRAGAESLSGTVVDTKGQPLVGALVRLRKAADRSERSGSRLGQGAPGPSSLSSAVRRSVDSYYSGRAGERHLTTDAQGRFEVTDLEKGRYRIDAWAEGYEIEHEDRRTTTLETGSTVQFTAVPLVALVAEVKSPTGGSPANAILEVNRRSGSSESTDSLAWTPAAPRVWVRPTRGRIRAASPDSQFLSEWQDVNLVIGETPQPLTFVLESRPAIHGVVKANGWGDGPFSVHLKKLKPGEEPDPDKMGPGNGRNWVHGSRPTFKFDDLTPGRYLVGAGPAWETVETHLVVEVQDSLVEIELEMPKLEASSVLVATVLGPEQEPLTDVTFQLTWGDPYEGSTGIRAVRQDDGTWWLGWPEEFSEWFQGEGNGAPGTLMVYQDGLGQTSEWVSLGQDSVLVRFATPAFLTVTVPGYTGSEWEGRLQVSLSEDDEQVSVMRAGFFDEDDGWSENGTYTIGPTAPGEYVLNLSITGSEEGFWGGGSMVSATPVVLHSGDNVASISVPPLYSVRVRFPDADEEEWVFMTHIGSEGGSGGQIGDNGIATFENLVAGEYRIQRWGGAGQFFMTVQVPTSADPVLFEAEPVNAYLITIFEASGHLAQAGLESGDLMVGMSGVEFQNLAQMQLLMASAAGQPTVKVSVQRGTRTFEVELNSEMLISEEGLGGSVEPSNR